MSDVHDFDKRIAVLLLYVVEVMSSSVVSQTDG